MDSTSKIVVSEVEEFIQMVLLAPSGKCRLRSFPSAGVVARPPAPGG